MSSRSLRVLIHVIAWTAFLLLPFLFFLPVDKLLKESPWVLVDVILIDALCISFYYFNYYVAIPKFFFTRKYFVYLLILLGWLSGIILIRVSLDLYPAPPTARGGFLGTSGVIIFRFVMIAVISFSEKTYTRWKQTEAAKLKTELSFLKAQINPHFLFNTLNSIYVLVTKKSDDAAESVVKLSSIMRYVITESDRDVVPLHKEISYVTDYIDLQKLRLAKNVKIEYDISGDIIGNQIAPLVLLPFIENIFKHGVSMEEVCHIKINIHIDQNDLTLKTSNSKITKDDSKESSGIGIPNAKKRLQLIYPERHSLMIEEDEPFYKVVLNIQL